MKIIDKSKDPLAKAWADVYRFYVGFYLPENDTDWDVMFQEAQSICRKYKDNELICLIISAILTYAEKRKRGEIDE